MGKFIDNKNLAGSSTESFLRGVGMGVGGWGNKGFKAEEMPLWKQRGMCRPRRLE